MSTATAATGSSLTPVYSSTLTQMIQGDCITWLREQRPETIHSVITDPPYGLTEFTEEHLTKLRNGKGGVWRIPPEIGGSKRSPLPRFTVLGAEGHAKLLEFFATWANALLPTLVPGAHVFVATSPLLSHLVSTAISAEGFEKRGEIARLVRTLRGGDRPKGAEEEFPEVSAMPRSCWEPWLVFRKPFEGTLADNLRRWGAGGLRRISTATPFCDVIESVRTPRRERDIAAHPSLKPQAFLRQLVRASVPLASGTILDPFAGSGSTLAACEAMGLSGIGIELDPHYASLAPRAIPALRLLEIDARQVFAFDLPADA